MPVNLIVGNDGSNSLQGTAGADLIYGFDPNGPQSQASAITATRVATGFSQPLFAVAPPGDTSRLFIVEKTGQIKILDLATGGVLTTPFLDVSSQILTDGERGLLGLAFDPDFASNGFLYINLINLSGDTEIRRYHVSSNPNIADPASVTPIITVDQAAASNHKAGWLGFGPDGDLYTATGDGGSTPGSAQDINSLLGKILRIDVHADDFPGDATRNYAIPADNPYVGVPGADEIYAIGLRNPWRPSFDRGLGDFYIADVGNAQWEEVDIGQKGANYGWPVFEGPAVLFGGTPTGGSAVPPIYSYDHSVGQSITGGYVYRGEGEALQGQYFFADFVQGKVFTLRFNGTAWVATERTSQIADFGAVGNVSSFGEDARGNLYLVDFDGDVFRLTPTVASTDQADMLRGLGGNDMLFGGSGDDTLDGGPGADALIGGPGMDTADYSFSSAGVNVNLQTGLGAGNDAQGDTLSGIENVIGSALADALTGDGGANTLAGGAGADTLIGGMGIDTADYSSSSAGITVSLLTGLGSGGHAQGDVLTGIENIIGSAQADSLAGDNGTNALDGRSGNDTLNGGAGSDTLAGGPGADKFVFDLPLTPAQAGSAVFDRILDYDQGNSGTFNLAEGDTLDLSALLAARVGQPVDDLVRVRENPSGTAAILQVDQDGAANGAHWTTIAQLDGVHTGDGVKVIFDASSATLTAPALVPSHNFNGDGKADILFQNDSGLPAIWTMDGSNITTGAYLPDVGPTWHVVAAADFNGDGKSDILWQNDSGLPAIWTMDGSNVTAGMFLTDVGPTWHVVAAADFNGDGKSDILWQNDSGLPAIWTMDGSNVTAGTFLTDVGPTWHVAATADFNGDGKSDILWQNDSGLPAIWTMDGSNVTAGTFLTDVGPTWHVAAAADFDGDGKSDILWQHDSGLPAIWTMDGSNVTAGTFLTDVGPTWHVAAAADFDGDGKSDILWQHDSGLPAIWTMDGTNITAGAVLPNPGHDWHLL